MVYTVLNCHKDFYGGSIAMYKTNLMVHLILLNSHIFVIV